jgi:putative ABC transport system permease protein
MGASASGLTMGLARDFLIWVGAAVVVAVPLAYWIARKILGMYAYRTPFGAGLFALAALAMLAVAALTVGAQTLRAARANPVDSLRYE